MANLYVGIVGLSGITKDGKLLVRSTTGKQKVGDIKIAKHNPIVVFRANGAMRKEPLEGEISFELSSSQQFTIKDTAKAFLYFSKLLDKNGDRASVHSLCLSGDCEELAGTVVFSRGILQPVEAYEDGGITYLDDVIEAQVTDRYRPTTKQKKNDFHMVKVASGGLLEVSLSASQVKIKIDGTSFDLQPGPLDKRKIKRTTDPSDIIVWVENLPNHVHNPSEKADIHFYLLYDLLHEGDIQRWVPVIDAPEHKVLPGSQCITPVMP